MMDKNLLEYKGQYSGEVRVQLIDLLRCIAQLNLGPRRDLKKLIGVALELLDNAQRYNAGTEVDFQWRIEDDQLIVTIRNVAAEHDARRLLEAVEKIKRMSPDEIGDAFQRQMTTEGFGEKGGAGLGILQIAKRVGNTISARIEPISADAYLCTSIVTAELRP